MQRASLKVTENGQDCDPTHMDYLSHRVQMMDVTEPEERECQHFSCQSPKLHYGPHSSVHGSVF